MELFGDEQEVVTKLAQEIRRGVAKHNSTTEALFGVVGHYNLQPYEKTFPHIASYSKYQTQLEKIL